ncbi:MAG: hypothetical protein IPO93_06000 [Actinobacteria bacterium]|jgi:hypothetical protein|nr:hypothetical protein [Actinomycetota bacterium]
MSAPHTRRLSVESIAPLIDGIAHPAPQPLGTWMTRWSFLYSEADVAHPHEPSGTTTTH